MSRIEYDVILVGAGPANLTLAHQLVEKADSPIRIAIFEKGRSIGAHLVSGAVTNPRVIKKLYPDWADSDFPLEGICSQSYVTILGSNEYAHVPGLATPPYFKKEGYAIISLANVAAYMANKIVAMAEEKDHVALDIYTGFPALSIVYDGERVVGVMVDDTGDHERDICYGKVTVFGDKGFASRDLKDKFGLSITEQTYAVGVKEVWETRESHEGSVWHTVGYPLPPGQLGGGFVYGCKNNRLIIGMVIGLDFANPNIDPTQVLQDFKKHSFIQEKIRGGKITHYGASIIPEGGYYSLPDRFAVDGAMMVGDALGILDVKSFSGVDKAMQSGLDAADTILEALKNGDFSTDGLADYKIKLMNGWVGDELKKSRYFRKAFSDYPQLLGSFIPGITEKIDKGSGLIGAGMVVALSDIFGSLKLLGARKMMDSPSDMGPVTYTKDHEHIQPDYDVNINISEGFDGATIYTTDDVVYYSHTHYEEDNNHIDEFSSDVCDKCIAEYDKAGKETPCVGDCTAAVHQTLTKNGARSHAMALENCVQCRTCEIVCPYQNLRVNAASHGYGPDFSGM